MRYRGLATSRKRWRESHGPMRRSSSKSWWALRLLPPLIAMPFLFAVLQGCAPEGDVSPGATEPASEPTQGSAVSAASSETGATSEQAAASAVTPPKPDLPGGLEVAANVESDPNLAADSKPLANATTRWGERGRNVESGSPWNSIVYDGIHARDSDAIGFLQEPRSALGSLPREGAGNHIDWVAAIRTGAIRPRARVGSQGSMELLDRDVLMVETKSMPYVTFPHLAHTEWLSCRNCHDWLFKAELGANDISMTDIARGRSCGLCHGKVAFPATECFRCHNGPRPGG